MVASLLQLQARGKGHEAEEVEAEGLGGSPSSLQLVVQGRSRVFMGEKKKSRKIRTSLISNIEFQKRKLFREDTQPKGSDVNWTNPKVKVGYLVRAVLERMSWVGGVNSESGMMLLALGARLREVGVRGGRSAGEIDQRYLNPCVQTGTQIVTMHYNPTDTVTEHSVGSFGELALVSSDNYL
ncbi:hypothetical protein J6590_081616 [Homalodisca vitripennis]|nr:hypothetical protein J6590_081616 [Homalodisca vitripennis]